MRFCLLIFRIYHIRLEKLSDVLPRAWVASRLATTLPERALHVGTASGSDGDARTRFDYVNCS